MKFLMSDGQILRDYRGAKDKKAQIGILADLNLCQKRGIAQFLHDHGEEVDGRLLRGPSKRSPSRESATPPAPEPAPVSNLDTEPPQALTMSSTEDTIFFSALGPPMAIGVPNVMKAGVLAALLAKVDPDAPVRLDGEGYAGWIHVSLIYGPDGEPGEVEICVHPLDE